MKQYQEKVDHWIKTIGKNYFSELTNLGQLTEEVGELARLIIRHYGDQSWKENEKPENISQKIGEEMSDILFVIFCMANQMKIDLEIAFRQKMLEKTKRDAQRHQRNTKIK